MMKSTRSLWKYNSQNISLLGCKPHKFEPFFLTTKTFTSYPLADTKNNFYTCSFHQCHHFHHQRDHKCSIRCYHKTIQSLNLAEQKEQSGTLDRKDNNSSGEDDITKKRKQLVMNARYRGRVETELLLGSYVTKEIWNMNEKQLEELEYLLNETDVDLYNWITGMQPIPEDLEQNSVLHKIIEYKSSQFGKKGLTTYHTDYHPQI